MTTLLIASLVLNLLLGVAWLIRTKKLPLTLLGPNGGRRLSQFEILDERKGGIVFVGDSLIEGGLWSELLGDPSIRNRGVGGDTTGDLLARADRVIALEPEKIFLYVGINDLIKRVPRQQSASNISRLLEGFALALPDTPVYVHAVVAPNSDWSPSVAPRDVDALDAHLRAEAEAHGHAFIDLRPDLCDEDGRLLGEYTNDGLHLLGPGYAIWRDRIAPFVAE